MEIGVDRVCRVDLFRSGVCCVRIVVVVGVKTCPALGIVCSRIEFQIPNLVPADIGRDFSNNRNKLCKAFSPLRLAGCVCR